jgi:hypothetical protein
MKGDSVRPIQGKGGREMQGREMHRLVAGILVVFLLWPLTALSTDSHGDNWLSLSANQKKLYIKGLVDGIDSLFYEIVMLPHIKLRQKVDPKKVGDIYKALQVDYKKNKRVFTGKEVWELLHSWSQWEVEVLGSFAIDSEHLNQIIEGVDAFYADFKNKQIGVVSAVYVVKKQIEGEPPEAIEAICQWLRKNDPFSSNREETTVIEKKEYNGPWRVIVPYSDKQGHPQETYWP